MTTNREIISKTRKRIQEKGADSTFTNKFIYSSLKEHAKWLIRREISAGRIYRSKSLFQTRPCMDVVPASKINDCCPIKTKCKVFRTRERLDDVWQDEFGPVITRVTSIDGSVEYTVLSAKDYIRKKNTPYSDYNKELYAFYDDHYIWFEETAPKKINTTGFFKDDISGKYGCEVGCCEDCLPFLDQEFMCPDWIEAEVIDKLVNQLLGLTKKVPDDTSIDKNTNRLT